LGLAFLVVIVSLLQLSHVTPALAATGTLYSDKVTDPHGAVWLPGTLDGTTAGPLNANAPLGAGADPAKPGYGYLWTSDVTSAFCRIVAPTVDAAGNPVPGFVDRNTPGACVPAGTAGQKPGDPTLDPRRNADGTFYVYAPDWAVGSQGVYRMKYNPGSMTFTGGEVLAPGRYPTNNKPFSTALGVQDGNRAS
jgi:hypothetical protein